ncbi:hypothetical protein X731_28385 [Mesorhizobium sp. L2C054A000]|nr:hypothetical protein X731_28385 [Mesorhizobium sp. L2C054A000]
MALSSQVVNFVWLRFLNHADEVSRISEVTVMQDQARIGFVRVLVEVFDTTRVEGRGTSLNPMNDVAFFEKKTGKIGTILSSYARNKSNFSAIAHSIPALSKV